MPIAGWVLFDGVPAESVLAFLGDELPVRLRNNLPRADVWAKELAEKPDCDPRSIAAGFSDLVPIPLGWSGRELEVVVRAHALDGRVWNSNPVSVHVTTEPAPTDEFDRGSPFLMSTRAVDPVSDAGTTRVESTRVCVFTHSLRLGGGELYLQELLLRLARDHNCQLLVVSPGDGPLKDELRAAGVSVHLTKDYAVDPVHYLAGIAELKTLLAVWRADAVIVNTLGVFPAVDAGLESGLPVIWAIHESFALETFAFMNWGTRGLHPAVRDRWLHCLTSASTTFESQATLELFEQQVQGLRGSVVRYGIDLAGIARYRIEHDRGAERAQLGFAPDELVLLCMGVIQERKSQLALVLAFAEVARLHSGSRLVIVGDHPSEYAGAVREAVDRLGIAHRVSLKPIRADIYQWYLAADVLVSASDTESLPRSVLEAMAFGRPVLAPDVFGLSEVISDGENGWLCQPRSGASLIAGLKRVLSSEPSELRTMSARCETDARAFDGAGYASAYAVMLRDAAAGRSAVGAGRRPEGNP